MAANRIDQPLYRRVNRDFTFVASPTVPEEVNQETINRSIDELPVFESKKTRYRKHFFLGFQVQPTAADNYESFNLVHTTNPEVSRKSRFRKFDFGWSQQPLSANAAVSTDESINNMFTELPRSRDRRKFPRVDFVQPPLADDADDSPVNHIHLVVPPGRNKRKFPQVGFTAAPLADDNDPSAARAHTELPFPQRSGRRRWPKVSFDGFVVAPLSADAPLDTPLPWPAYPDFLYPSRQRNRKAFQTELGFSASPTPGNVVNALPTIWRPTFRPRRR